SLARIPGAPAGAEPMMSKQAEGKPTCRHAAAPHARFRGSRAIPAILVMAAALVLLGGCSTPRTYFYTLTPAQPRATQLTRQPAFLIAVQPVDIPPAVNRPQLLIRVSPQQVVPM